MRKLKLLGILIFIILLTIVVFILTGNEKSPEGPDRGEGNFISDLFGPRSDREMDRNSTLDQSFIPEPNTKDQEELVLQKISSMPVAGYGVFMQEDFVEVAEVESPEGEDLNPTTIPVAPATEFKPTLRYADKITGNIYQTEMEEINEKKISDIVIPGTKEAYFTSLGESVVMRYLKQDGETIASFVGSLPTYTLGGDQAPEEMEGSFLPDNITSIGVSEDNRMFYITESEDSVSGIVSNYIGSSKIQIFDSPFTEWLVEWPSQSAITVATKASASALGYIYSINPANGDFNKLIGDIPGLTGKLNSKGNLLLYANSDLGLNVMDIDTGYIESLRIKTLPEKCVWSGVDSIMYCAVPKTIDSNFVYPDSWYQGEVSFIDQIWEIDIIAGTEKAILDPISVRGGENMDIVDMKMDSNKEYLFFINKKDSMLWSLKLNK